jgi:hypothetical protein
MRSAATSLMGQQQESALIGNFKHLAEGQLRAFQEVCVTAGRLCPRSDAGAPSATCAAPNRAPRRQPYSAARNGMGEGCTAADSCLA